MSEREDSFAVLTRNVPAKPTAADIQSMPAQTEDFKQG